jgi:alpha-L-rhamnosidase
VLQGLLDEVERYDYHATAGFLGVMPMLHVLSDLGHIDEAYRIVTQEDSPGWLHMLQGGNDTLGENLNAKGYGTLNHPFAACVGSWMFRDLAGIAPCAGLPGSVQFVIHPKIPKGLDWVKAEYSSMWGMVRVHWRTDKDVVTVEAELPANTTAILVAPDGTQHRIGAGLHRYSASKAGTA